VAAIEELRGDDLAPELWKLEGMPSSNAYAAVAEACEAGADDGPKCLVLGRGADTHAVERWLTLAASVPGFAGFAVGRTIWWQPLRAALDGLTTDHDAEEAIAENYRRMIDVYLSSYGSSTR
jgi:myo-inositol catabolism protein IolC